MFSSESLSGDVDEADRLRLLGKLLGEDACRRLGIYLLPDGFLLSVVIPVYNEVDSIAVVVDRVRTSGVPCEIVIVDDASTDGTRQLLEGWEQREDVKIVFHEKNQGKGAALATGLREVSGDAVIIQDADLEYDPAEYRYLLQPIVQDNADFVLGSRFSGDSQRVLFFWHYLGNRLLTTLSNCFTNLNLSDMESCYKVFRREVVELIGPTLQEKRFGIEPEIVAKVASLPEVRVFERPISYRGRTYAEGKKIGWRDGVSAFRCILKYRRGLRGQVSISWRSGPEQSH
jgi:glycosyltransferase involved in cell wall biosynthesis